MVSRLLLMTLSVVILSGCESEPKVFSDLLVTRNRHFIHEDAYPQQTVEEFQDSVSTIARLVTYPFVVTSALRNENVARSESIRAVENPEDWLVKQLRVTTMSNLSDTAFIRIAISNDVPSEDAAMLVNAVTAAFQREVIDKIRQERRLEFEELQHLRKEVVVFSENPSSSEGRLIRGRHSWTHASQMIGNHPAAGHGPGNV